MKRKKFKLIRTASFILSSTICLTVLSLHENKSYENIPYTNEDLVNNEQYLTELENIKLTIPVFSNKELYDIICNTLNKELITKDDLLHVKDITIDNISDTDLNELKYLENLKNITIRNNNYDLSDLEYNENLMEITIEDSNVINTDKLPNSIKTIWYSSVKVLDNNFYIPYNTKNIYLVNTYFNNFTLKCPYNLKTLSITGDAFLDLESLKEAENLNNLTLKRITNIKNSYILEDLNIKELCVDDYCPIWLNAEEINNLKIKDKDQYLEEALKLDEITSDILKNTNSEDEIIKRIVLYTIENIEYDQTVSNQEKNASFYTTIYNAEPINYALNGKGVCINYLALFQSLCNRAGIESYGLKSTNHGWNAIKKGDKLHYIDPTFLDNKAIYLDVSDSFYYLAASDKSAEELLKDNRENELYYYDFDYVLEQALGNESHEAILLPKEKVINNNIGYVKTSNTDLTYFVKINDKIYELNKIELISKLFILYMFVHTVNFGKEMAYEKRKKRLLKMKREFEKEMAKFEYLDK